MPISALPFAPQLKLHLDKMTAFENGAEWHPCLSVPHLLTTLNHYPLNLKRSGTIIPVGAGPLVATPRQYSAEAVRTVLNDMSGRAEPFVEQRDEGGSDDYYLKRGGGGGAEGGGDGAE